MRTLCCSKNTILLSLTCCSVAMENHETISAGKSMSFSKEFVFLYTEMVVGMVLCSH